jgi:hypothetical protein
MCQQRYRISTGENAVKKVTRLRPSRHDAIRESLQLILEMPLDQPQEVLDFLSDALGRFSPPGSWSFVMMNPDQQRLVLKAISDGPRPFSTLKIWAAAISHIRYDTGEIMAGRARLAEDVGISPDEASRALAQLAEIGALIRISRGRYKINPYVGWTGSMVKREAATVGVVPLRVVSAD